MSSLYARLHQRFGTPTAPAIRHRNAQNISQGLNSLSPLTAVRGLADHVATGAAMAQGKPAKPPSVAVIGAGFSGLMAASALAPLCSVTVFEARDRMGGRVWTDVDKSRHRAIERGAELIGYNHAMWLLLAKRFDLGMTVLTTEDAYDAMGLNMPLYVNGHFITDKKAGEIYDEVDRANKLMIHDAIPMSNPFKPWDMPGAQRLDDLSVADWINRHHFSDLAETVMKMEFSNTNGAPAERQSYLGLLSAVKGGAFPDEPDAYFNKSETVKCEQGNDMLAKKLAEETRRHGGSVLTSTPIKHVEIRKGLARLTLADDQTRQFDYVVLAIPPSLWSGGSITIDPPIPDDCRMTMGSAVKYLSNLDSRFWFGKNLSPSSTSKDIGITWEGSDNQMQLDGQTVTLSLFAGGPAADTGMRFPSPAARDLFYSGELGKLYPGYASHRLSTDFVCWPKEQWTEAGYSCPAPGEVMRVGQFLSAPYHDRLYFAGEHCCPAFYGYMEGALQSGAATAAAIMLATGVA